MEKVGDVRLHQNLGLPWQMWGVEQVKRCGLSAEVRYGWGGCSFCLPPPVDFPGGLHLPLNKSQVGTRTLYLGMQSRAGMGSTAQVVPDVATVRALADSDSSLTQLKHESLHNTFKEM